MNQASTGGEVTLRTLRKRTWQIVEPADKGDRLSQIFDVCLIILILLNVAAIVLESVPEMQNRYLFAFVWLERISLFIFTIEYLSRLWSCVEEKEEPSRLLQRVRFALRPLSIVDFLAILPGILFFLFPGVDLRILRALRILRIFKLSRYSAAFRTMRQVFTSEADSLAAAVIVLLTTLLLVSTGIYFVEQEAQPEHFGTIPKAMWWSVVTLTTVGYGDVTPITTLGKLFGGMVTIVGIGIVALPTGIIASSFSHHMRLRKELYEQRLIKALEDGRIDQEERNSLHDLREELGLNSEQVKIIEAAFAGAKEESEDQS